MIGREGNGVIIVYEILLLVTQQRTIFLVFSGGKLCYIFIKKVTMFLISIAGCPCTQN